MTPYPLFTMAATILQGVVNTTSGFVFVDVTAFRMSKSIRKANYFDTSQLTGEISQAAR